jgi:chemosensory pili system protein ChpA (sensor histidine kinase/response regulator)
MIQPNNGPRDKGGELALKDDLIAEHVSDKPSRKPRVLVVDDDVDALRSLSEVLESEGFDTLCVEDGQEAWQLMHQRRPDHIVLDLQMPRMDGRTLRMHQRREPKLANIPVVIVSAHTRGETRG